MKFYIVRHGRPERAEQGKVFLGVTDVALSEAGAAQSGQAGAILKEKTGCRAVKIVTSPLMRCFQTASIIKEHVCCSSFETDPRLREIDMGIWDGKLIDDIRDEYPEEYRARGQDLWNYKVPEGESFAETGKRFCSALEDIIRNEPDDSIVIIVSHAGAVRAGLSLLTEMPFSTWMKRDIPYAGIAELEICLREAAVQVRMTAHDRQ